MTGRLHVRGNLAYVSEFQNKSLDEAQGSALRPLACHELAGMLPSTFVAQIQRIDTALCVFDPVTTCTK